jgi:osmotically-inducible protein OsmY
MNSTQLMEQRAFAALESHPHFRGRSKWIEIRYRDRCLSLRGKLPSFFLKQIAQESLRQLDGVDTIENQIVVVSPQGQFERKLDDTARRTRSK